MKTSLNDVQQKLEEALAPYGYYLARKDRETELPLTLADVGLFALAVLLWGTVEYAKSFLQEKAKADAKRLSGEFNSDAEQLEQQLHEMLHELHALREQVEMQQKLYEFNLPEEDLTQYLWDCGLSKRASRKVARELKPLLESQIQLLILEDE